MINRREFFKSIAAITIATQVPTAFAIEEKAAALERLGKHEFFLRSFYYELGPDDSLEIRLIADGLGEWSHVEMKAGFTITDKARMRELGPLRAKFDRREPVVLDWREDMTDFRLDGFVLTDMHIDRSAPSVEITSLGDAARRFI